MTDTDIKDLYITNWKLDVSQFLKDLFPKHFSKPFATFHLEIFDALTKYLRVAIAAPRKFGKSQLISFGWAMYNLLLNPDNHFTIIISNNYANACKYLVPLKEELEHNVLLKTIFGSIKSDKWSENEIETTTKKKIIVGGNDFKIRGQKYLQYRPDLIIIDDAEDDEMVRSEERRGDFEHWLLYSLDPAMTNEKNQIVVIGTILHRDSQLSKLMTTEGKYKDWTSRLYTALVNEKSTWEDAITTEWLLGEKSKEPYVFSQEYMNNPVPYEHAMFKQEYFKEYAKEDLPKDLIINITVDLACTDKTYSDFTVIMPVGIDVQGDLWVLPYFRDKYTDPDKIIDQILNMYSRYADSGVAGWKFGKVGIEKTGFQRFLVSNFIKERKKRGLHFAITEIEAKGDKISRIARLQPWFASGDIHTRADMLDLKEESLDFPRARKDDCSDCLSYQLDIMSQKPVIKNSEVEPWRITPERQRKRILRGREQENRLLVYNRF